MRAPAGPVWVAEVDLDRSLSPEGICRPPSTDDAASRILVRRRGEVVGFVTVIGPAPDAQAVAAAVTAQLGVRDFGPAPSSGHCEPLPLSVVVCTRDRPEMLAMCLKTLQDLQYPAYEVVVVDNAPSTPASAECFDRLVGDDPRFRYVLEPVPGLSRARNRGLAEATAAHVAFTDDDAQVDPSLLGAIAAGFEREPSAGCVTGLVPAAALDHPAQQYFDRRYSWASRLDRRVYRLAGGDSSPLYPYSAGLFGTGANFAVDRELVLDLGGFDEALGAGSPAGGGEELDVFVRVLRAGRPLVYEPSAVVWHVHRDDARSARRQLFAYGAGLTAFLTKYLLDRRTTADIVTRVAPGARRIWSMWREVGLEGRPPLRLVAAEAAGMATGPATYLWGRRRLRRGPRA